MAARIAIVLALLVVAAGLTIWWRRREGRFTEAHGRFERADLRLTWRDRPAAVVVEFFGEHCAPCVTVRERLEGIARELPDVQVVTIDAAERLDLAERYHVRRVPTLFVTDGGLRVVWRASGVPSEDAIRAALLGPDWAGRPRAREQQGPR